MMNSLKCIAGILTVGLTMVSGAAKEVVCRIETDRDIYQAGTRQKAVVKVSLDAPVVEQAAARPPVNLTIVLDRSGSMSGNKLEKAKEAAVAALRRLGPQDLFSLVTYDTSVNTVIPAQSAANTEWIEGRIQSIHHGGNTALFAGVSQGASEIRKNLSGNYIHRMLLLSDGLANRGPSTPAELGRLGSALMKEGIAVTTIGVGTDYNEDLMTRLSQRSDGNTYFVESSQDLPHIFAAELGEVLSVVATSVEVEIVFPEGVRPLRFIGREGRIGRQNAQFDLNQLYGGQEKYALVEVELPEGFAGETRQIAEAQLRYENRINQKAATGNAIARVQFSEREKEVEKSVNKPVVEAQIVNTLAVGNDQAVQMADDLDNKGASKLIYENINWAKYTAKKYDVQIPDQVLQVQVEDAEELGRSSSFSRVQRKSMKTRNSAVITGQRTAPVASSSNRFSWGRSATTNRTEQTK